MVGEVVVAEFKSYRHLAKVRAQKVTLSTQRNFLRFPHLVPTAAAQKQMPRCCPTRLTSAVLLPWLLRDMARRG
jgi:hypothetical protein